MNDRRINLNEKAKEHDALKEIEGRLHKLSYRDLTKLTDLLFEQIDALDTTPGDRCNLAEALLRTADEIQKA